MVDQQTEISITVSIQGQTRCGMLRFLCDTGILLNKCNSKNLTVLTYAQMKSYPTFKFNHTAIIQIETFITDYHAWQMDAASILQFTGICTFCVQEIDNINNKDSNSSDQDVLYSHKLKHTWCKRTFVILSHFAEILDWTSDLYFQYRFDMKNCPANVAYHGYAYRHQSRRQEIKKCLSSLLL